MLRVRVTHINASEGHIFSEYTEALDGDMTRGQFYRDGVTNYGRCISKVYVDGPDGPPIHVGYVFEKRERYEDTGEPYKRETWLVLEDVQPAMAVALDALEPAS